MVNSELRSEILVYGLPGGTLRSLYLVSYVSSSVCFELYLDKRQWKGVSERFGCLARRDGGFSPAVCRL